MKKRLFIFLAAIQFFSSKAQICFASASHYAAIEPYSICTADFNGDGKPDLATGNQSGMASSKISILLGNGIGGFNSPLSFTVTEGRIISLTSADFNGDGNADLALANYDTNFVSVFLGNGTGGFGPPTNLIIGVSGSDWPAFLTNADFNMDGKVDLAVAVVSATSWVSVFLGNGNGTFGTITNFTIGTGASEIISGDFNNDTKVDLATANWYSNTVSVLLGNGTGSFQAVINATASGASSLCSKDFNGDGKPDIATVNGTTNISVLLGTGTGSFGAATLFGAGIGTRSIISADFNLDCKADLAVAK